MYLFNLRNVYRGWHTGSKGVCTFSSPHSLCGVLRSRLAIYSTAKDIWDLQEAVVSVKGAATKKLSVPKKDNSVHEQSKDFEDTSVLREICNLLSRGPEKIN